MSETRTEKLKRAGWTEGADETMHPRETPEAMEFARMTALAIGGDGETHFYWKDQAIALQTELAALRQENAALKKTIAAHNKDPYPYKRIEFLEAENAEFRKRLAAVDLTIKAWTPDAVLISDLINSDRVVISGGPHKDWYKVIITGPEELLKPLLDIGTNPLPEGPK